MKTRTNQGGSIVTFILIGAVLLAGLGTGIYYLANGRSFAPQPQEIAANPDRDTDTSEKTDDKPAAAPADETKEEKPAGSPFDNGNEEAPAVADPDTKTPQPAPTATESDDAAEPQELATTGRQAPTVMPQTGASDTLLGFVGIALISFASIAYARSLRAPVTK